RVHAQRATRGHGSRVGARYAFAHRIAIRSLPWLRGDTMRKFTVAALVLGAGLMLAGCSSGGGSDTTKVGLGVPITGPNAAFGAQIKEGAEQAIADINESGGILGKKLSSMIGDDVSDPKQGVSVANNF